MLIFEKILRTYCTKWLIPFWNVGFSERLKNLFNKPISCQLSLYIPLEKWLKSQTVFQVNHGYSSHVLQTVFLCIFFFVDICKANMLSLSFLYTVWRVFKYGVFSGPYLDTFHAVLLIWFVWTYMKILAINTTIIVKFMIYATDSF